MTSKNIISISISNKILIKLIDRNQPFIITRLGHAIGTITALYLQNKPLPNQKISALQTHDGIYCNTFNDLRVFVEKYSNAIKNSTYLASFPTLCVKQQNYFINKYNLHAIHNKSIEPFYSILEGDIPWTHNLNTKKVLIIHPFVKSFKKQLDNNFTIFKDKSIFKENQQFIFYKSYNTLAGNRPHKNWIETFEIMCNDIAKLDFDIALLGCGGYGLPLCNFIYKKMNKSAIYIGGGLQLLFGVMGSRWENNSMWKKIIKENNCKFIRPSGDEILKNRKYIENGCYW